MTKDLWKKCAKTDYSRPTAKCWIELYASQLLKYELTLEELAHLHQAINVIEGLKDKYK